MEVKCPICGVWISYPYESQRPPKTERALRLRASNPKYVYGAFQFHLYKEHRDTLLEALPVQSQCPYCGLQLKQVPGRPYLAVSGWLKHIMYKHPDQLNDVMKEKLGVDLSPNALEWRNEDKAPQEQPQEEPKAEVTEKPKVEVIVEAKPEEKEPVATATETVSPSFSAVEAKPEPEGKIVIEEVPKTEDVGAEAAKEGASSAEGEPAMEEKLELPESFERTPLLKFLENRVVPFHGPTVPEKAAKREKPEKKERKGRPLLIYLVGLAGLGLIGFGIARYIKAKKAAEAAAQAQAQNIQTAETSPSETTNPGVEEQPPGAYIDAFGRYHSALYPDKNIM